MSRRSSSKIERDIGSPYEPVEDWDEGQGTSVYETDLAECVYRFIHPYFPSYYEDFALLNITNDFFFVL